MATEMKEQSNSPFLSARSAQNSLISSVASISNGSLPASDTFTTWKAASTGFMK